MTILLLLIVFIPTLQAHVILGYLTTKQLSPACENYFKKVDEEYQCCRQQLYPAENFQVSWWFPGLPELPSDIGIISFSIQYCTHLLQELQCANKVIERLEYSQDRCGQEAVVQFLKAKESFPEARMRYLCNKNATVLREFYRTGSQKCLRPNSTNANVSHTSLCDILSFEFDLFAEKFPPNCQKFKTLVNCYESDWKSLCGVTSSALLKGFLRAIYEPLHCKDVRQKKPWSTEKAVRSGSQLAKGQLSYVVWFIAQLALLLFRITPMTLIN